MRSRLSFGLAFALSLAAASPAGAQNIVQDLTNSTVTLSNGGFGQSFVAGGGLLDAVTVYLSDFNPHLGAYDLTLRLYAGEGYGGALLATRNEVLPDGFSGGWRVELGGLGLVPGATYSIRVTSASGRGGIQLNQHSFPGGGAINVDYPGGHLLSSAGAPNDLFDLRFRVSFDTCLASIEQGLSNQTTSLNNNVFGQSFRPLHNRLDAVSVYLADFNPALGAYAIRVDVYAGIGYGGALVFTSTQNLADGFAGEHRVDTGGLAVTPGADYSIRVSSASGRGGVQLNQHSFPGGGAINVDYPGGDLLTGAGGAPNPIFDLRFRVEGHAAGHVVTQNFTNQTTSLNGLARGQSFIAEGPRLRSANVTLADFNPHLGGYEIQMDLFAGQGYGGARLATHVERLPDGFTGSWRVPLDVALTPGSTYTLRVTSASGRGGIQINQHSFPGGGAINVDYPGGHFINPDGTPNPLFDLRFALEFGRTCVLDEVDGALVAVCDGAVIPLAACEIREHGDGTVTVRCADVCIDAADLCPDDPAKLVPGACGCGLVDEDGDGDGTLDCDDGCPADAAKIDPGQCGCGTPDTDGDGDGTADCVDGCPADAGKVAAGVCGCGTPDTDGDGDGTADCFDGCPADPGKVVAGICGCGTSDGDSDGDGVIDCFDSCPADPAKVDTGVCGCGVADSDGDGDGAPDCVDFCFEDPGKVDFGVCGCGVADTDRDGDGVADCVDFCADDPGKVDFGKCGCGLADVDRDGDGDVDTDDCVPDCAPPVAVAGADLLTCGTEVTLDGSESSADCGGLTLTWSLAGAELGQGAGLTVDLPAGVHEITLTACDQGGGCAEDTLTVDLGGAGPWPFPDEVAFAAAFNRLYCAASVEDDPCGLADLLAERGVPYPDTFTTADIAEVQVLAYETSVLGAFALEVAGPAPATIDLYDPGPWVAPSRGWLPDAGSPTIDLAAVLADHGLPADTPFRFSAGGALLDAGSAAMVAGAEPGEWLIGHNDGGAGEGDANEPIVLAMAPLSARVPACPPGYAVFVGTNGPDVIIGTPGRDCIYGLGGDDDLRGGAGDDLIFGGRGDDRVNAARGADYVSGGSCHDFIRGREGDDTLDGDAGDDTLSGGAGQDLIRGGAGHDSVNGDGGDDSVWGDAGDDLVVGGDGADDVHGGEGDDDVRGGNGADLLTGGPGDDHLRGGRGDDDLDGGDGIDITDGGPDQDACTGGETVMSCEL